MSVLILFLRWNKFLPKCFHIYFSSLLPCLRIVCYYVHFISFKSLFVETRYRFAWFSSYCKISLLCFSFEITNFIKHQILLNLSCVGCNSCFTKNDWILWCFKFTNVACMDTSINWSRFLRNWYRICIQSLFTEIGQE